MDTVQQTNDFSGATVYSTTLKKKGNKRITVSERHVQMWRTKSWAITRFKGNTDKNMDKSYGTPVITGDSESDCVRKLI